LDQRPINLQRHVLRADPGCLAENAERLPLNPKLLREVVVVHYRFHAAQGDAVVGGGALIRAVRLKQPFPDLRGLTVRPEGARPIAEVLQVGLPSTSAMCPYASISSRFRLTF
jgi:hypothetical protein